MEVQSRTGRIVVAYRLGTLGAANSLLCGVKRCENDYQPFSLSFQIRTVEPKGSIGSNPRPTPPKEKIEDTTRVSSIFWRCRPDLNRRITVLQTGALPLGYCTKFLIALIL